MCNPLEDARSQQNNHVHTYNPTSVTTAPVTAGCYPVEGSGGSTTYWPPYYVTPTPVPCPTCGTCPTCGNRPQNVFITPQPYPTGFTTT